MDKELKKQVADVVASLFNEKEDAEIRRKTEKELQKSANSIAELTTALEDKNAEVAAFEEKISEGENRIQELESELEAAKTELETANTKLSETEQTLEDMKKDRAAEIRMTELEDAGVARSDKDSQMTKVREMTEEEFASYKDELVSIREAVLSELEEARQQAEADAKAEEEAAEEAKESEEEASEESEAEEASEESASEEEVTDPAEISPGQAAMASLNLEYIPSEDMVSKYADLGKAMAARWTKSEE
jgi:nucleoporin NUP159